MRIAVFTQMRKFQWEKAHSNIYFEQYLRIYGWILNMKYNTSDKDKHLSITVCVIRRQERSPGILWQIYWKYIYQNVPILYLYLVMWYCMFYAIYNFCFSYGRPNNISFPVYFCNILRLAFLPLFRYFLAKESSVQSLGRKYILIREWDFQNCMQNSIRFQCKYYCMHPRRKIRIVCNFVHRTFQPLPISPSSGRVSNYNRKFSVSSEFWRLLHLFLRKYKSLFYTTSRISTRRVIDFFIIIS